MGKFMGLTEENTYFKQKYIYRWAIYSNISFIIATIQPNTSSTSSI